MIRQKMMIAIQTLSAFLQEIVFSLVLSDLHQIVLSPPPCFVGIHAGFIRLFPDLGARVGSQRHCWLIDVVGFFFVALEVFDQCRGEREE